MVTLARPSNGAVRTGRTRIVDVLASVSRRLPLVFAVHPRTRARLREFGLATSLERQERIRLSEPLRYNEFMNLVCHARLAIPDSRSEGHKSELQTLMSIAYAVSCLKTKRKSQTK